MPNDVDDGKLAKWGLADVQQRILRGAIDDALAARGEGAEFEQLFNFRYADRTQMLTVGGMIVTPALRQAFDAAKFHELDQVSCDTTPVLISAPALTAKEALHLNQQLPRSTEGNLECPGLDAEAKDGYERYYRWYPPVPAPI